MNEEKFGPQSRKAHQMALQRRRLRLRRRRQKRIRRIRRIRALRSVGFWSRAISAAAILFGLVFWAKFAFVYDIPNYAERGQLLGVKMYVTVKPWWFGPPVFNLETYGETTDLGLTFVPDDYAYMLLRLGRYDAVVTTPNMIWTGYRNGST